MATEDLGTADYDLTYKICQYYDTHLALPMLEFLQTNSVYYSEVIAKTKLTLLKHSKMVDYTIQTYQELYGTEDIPEDLNESREAVRKEFRIMETRKEELESILDREESKRIMQYHENNDKAFEELCDQQGLSLELLGDLYKFSKLNYECGDYALAASTLTWFIYLTPSNYDNETIISAMWGKLACEILHQDFDEALISLDKMKEQIDREQISLQAKQYKRAWWINWGLYVFFHHPEGFDRILSIFAGTEQDPTEDRVLLSTIQSQCPYIFRYLGVVALLSTRQGMVLKLTQHYQDNSIASQDPILEFLIALYKEFDFEKTQEKLGACFKAIKNDFFLTNCYQAFMSKSRKAIVQHFISIHQCIYISSLANCMHLNPEEAEQWIVKYIREMNLDAKINAKEANVVITKHPKTVHQQVIDKTRDALSKTYLLHAQVKQKYEQNLQKKQKAK